MLCLPERFPLIAVNLVERLSQSASTPFQFDMHHWQSVYEYRHVISVLGSSSRRHILVNHLHPVVAEVALVNELDVFRLAVVTLYAHYGVPLLYEGSLCLDVHCVVCNLGVEQSFPFSIAKLIVVKPFELRPQIGYKRRLVNYMRIVVALGNELFYQLRLQGSLALK